MVPAMEDDLDSGGLTGRVARYGKVSGAMAGLAARLAGERFLGIKISRSEHAAQLMAALGALKGPLMKVGQILATIPEALPPEYAAAFQQLQANAPSMGWTFVRRRMKTELGPDWEKKFRSFGHEAAAAASLGQVHRAVGLDGRDLACKLQYPDMRAAVESDLRQLQMIFSLYERYDSSIATRHIHAELSQRLFEELDYTLEARHCALYAAMLRGEQAAVHVPEIVPELSTARLLTATWLEGARILDCVDAPQERRNRIAVNLFRAWYAPLYGYGVIHGDPHLGNYTVRADDSVNLLDFGCVRVFPPTFVHGVIELYRALAADDRDRAVHAFEIWGFGALNAAQIEALDLWARFLYAPVLEDKVRPIGEPAGGVYGRETAREVHRRLREAGRITVPREFVFMDRAALGLGSVFMHLRATVNWHRLFNALIEDFSLEALRRRQREQIPPFGLALPDEPASPAPAPAPKRASKTRRR